MRGITIRPARPGDEAGVAMVHVRAWQHAYRGLLPDDYLDSLQAEDRVLRYTFGMRGPTAPHTILALDAVAEERSSVLGFATVVVADQDRALGELSALYVDPRSWNRGVGVALIAAARTELRERGCTEAFLWLLEGNARGERFYGRDGWAPDGTRRADTVWGNCPANHTRRHRLPRVARGRRSQRLG